MVGLVRQTGWNPFKLTNNHQVLAYAYEVDGDAVTLRIYDPNWPGRDDVGISVSGRRSHSKHRRIVVRNPAFDLTRTTTRFRTRATPGL